MQTILLTTKTKRVVQKMRKEEIELLIQAPPSFLFPTEGTMKNIAIILFLCFGAPLFGVVSEETWPLVSLREKNKQADTAFLAWRVSAEGSTISSELHKALTPQALEFLVDKSQIPFTLYKDQKKLKEQIRKVVDKFIQRYKDIPAIQKNRRELEELVGELILPEFELSLDPQAIEVPDKAYNDFIERLSLYKTNAGTYLHEWALRYLTSEAQLVALEILERETRKGSSFNLLSDRDKGHLLDKVSQVVVRQFMQNLQPVLKKFHIKVPPYVDMAIKSRVDLFLHVKFGL